MKAIPVQKTVGGVTFEDRYAHLHDDTPENLAWQWDRSAQAEAAAQASPNYRAVHDRLLQLGDAGGYAVPTKRGALWFSMGAEDGSSAVQVSDTAKGPARTVVSAKAIADLNNTSNVFITWMTPSPKGRFVALGWGANGDMTGQWSVYETATGRHVLDTVGILYSGARAGWLPDESGFWLNGRTEEGLHSLRFVPAAEGAAERPVVVLPPELVEAKHSGLTLHVSPDGRRGVAVTEPHEHVALVHLDLDTLEATPFLPEGFKGECDGSWIDGETYVARVNNGIPRGRVVAIPASTSRDMLTWREVVPESEGFIGWAGVVAGKLYVGDLVDVSLRVRVFALDGRLIETLPLEKPGSAPSLGLERAVRPTDAFVFTHATFTRSGVTFLHDPETGELRQLDEAKYKLDDVVAEQRFAISKDGTRIPYFVVRSSKLPIGPQPTLVHGYGGFNFALVPSFPGTFAPFIEAGGIFVQACLRGGAEYGKAWHDAGRLFNKRNTFDDLQAVAETLIAEGVSTPDKMAFMGGSNGGLLAGAAIVYQPHLWRAVVPTVPIYDIMEMVPLVAENAGIRAIMYEDYGDTTKPDVAQSVITWSPYHNIQDKVVYPAIYQVFGEMDSGCMPFQGRKFTARLDETNAGDRPIHFRVWRDTGHGAPDPVKSAMWNGEWLAFVMDHIGMTAKGATA